jgi:hypothetical protein
MDPTLEHIIELKRMQDIQRKAKREAGGEKRILCKQTLGKGRNGSDDDIAEPCDEEELQAVDTKIMRGGDLITKRNTGNINSGNDNIFGNSPISMKPSFETSGKPIEEEKLSSTTLTKE